MIGAHPRDEAELTGAISAAIVDLYARFYGHRRTTATTYLNGRIVVCVLESILTREEDALIAEGSRGAVIDGRVAFQTGTEDEFTSAVERLTHRRVTAFLSANQTTPGVACELFSSMSRLLNQLWRRGLEWRATHRRGPHGAHRRPPAGGDRVWQWRGV